MAMLSEGFLCGFVVSNSRLEEEELVVRSEKVELEELEVLEIWQ